MYKRTVNRNIPFGNSDTVPNSTQAKGRLLKPKKLVLFISSASLVLISGASAHAVVSNSNQAQAETIEKVSSGMRHNCALTSLGRVACWGDGSMGQLGISENSSSNFEMDNYSKVSTPVFIEKLQGVTDISAGTYHTCAVLSSGQVACWGLGYNGQLGNGKRNIEYSPVFVNGVSNIASVSPGTYHTCAIDNAGKVFCWGSDTRGYGSTRTGQLGDGLPYKDSFTPVQVKGLTSHALKISSGESHTCAILITKKLQCWGKGNWGGLGNGSFKNSPIAAQVSGPTSTQVTDVSASFENTCEILGGEAKGEVWCWGFRAWGTLGDGSFLGRNYSGASKPVKTLISGATFLDSGGGSVCAVVENQPWCWGSNLFGQLQNSSAPTPTQNWFVDRSSNPSKIILPTPIFGVTVSKGIEFESTYVASVCAWSSLDVYCWGGGEPTGQLGSGEFTEGLGLPTRVVFPVTGQISKPGAPSSTRVSLANDSVNLEINHEYDRSQGYLIWQVRRLDTGQLVCQVDGRKDFASCSASGFTHRQTLQFSVQGRNEAGLGEPYLTETIKYCVSNPVRIVTTLKKDSQISGSQFSVSGYWENHCSDPKNEIEYRTKLLGQSWSGWNKIPLVDSTRFNLLKNFTYNSSIEFRGLLDSQYFYAPILQIRVASKNLNPINYSSMAREVEPGISEGSNLQVSFAGDPNYNGICTISAVTGKALDPKGSDLGTYSKSMIVYVFKGSGAGLLPLEWNGLYKLSAVCRDPNFLEIRTFKVLRIK